MKRVLAIVGGLLLAIVIILVGVATWIVIGAARPARPVGFEDVTVRDPQDKPLDVGIWYPTNAPARLAIFGLTSQWVANRGAVIGRSLPLIVISHGNGGSFASHADTALALASAGYVVAAVTHTGDNVQDQSYVGTSRWLIDRPRHIRLVIDYMLRDWHARGQFDPARVGIFGFSAGGFTALVAIGGVPDFAVLASHCRKMPEFACTLWKKFPAPVPASSWIHDPRIRAAVIAAPGYGFAFAPQGLANVKAAVQLWNGKLDRNVPYATNEAVIRRLIPTPLEYHAVDGAAHFAFLQPCPAWLVPALCKDPAGFDRKAFHDQLNRSMISFFDRTLAESQSAVSK